MRKFRYLEETQIKCIERQLRQKGLLFCRKGDQIILKGNNVREFIFKNDFHGTQATAFLRAKNREDRVYIFSPSQTQRIVTKLCPRRGCPCGVVRGMQEWSGYWDFEGFDFGMVKRE